MISGTGVNLANAPAVPANFWCVDSQENFDYGDAVMPM